jgi:hypothetical protein
MSNLTTTPFTVAEERKQYKIATFTEMGVTVNILNEATIKHKIPSGNFYKFGVIKNGKYFWYFNSVPVANDRQKMLDFYSAIKAQSKSTTDIPFIFKVKRV